MDDGAVGAIAAVIVAAVAYGVFSAWTGQRRTAERRRRKARDIVEGRIADLLAEFPALSDAELAQLVRDELQNKHVTDPDLFNWATTETAGRVRRTIGVAVIRAMRNG